MKKSEKKFYQGFAAAIASIIQTHRLESIGISTLYLHGITLQILVDAECDEEILKIIRPGLIEREKWERGINGRR